MIDVMLTHLSLGTLLHIEAELEDAQEGYGEWLSNYGASGSRMTLDAEATMEALDSIIAEVIPARARRLKTDFPSSQKGD